MRNKKPDLVHIQDIECHGVMLIHPESNIDRIRDDRKLIDLNMLSQSDLPGHIPTRVLIQHFRDGTTRVLCKYKGDDKDDNYCSKSDIFSREKREKAINKIVDHRPEEPWGLNLGAEIFPTCPYAVGQPSFENSNDNQ